MEIKNKPKIEHKLIGGHIVEAKQEERDGMQIGFISGYGATWDLDRGGWDGVKDRFVKGAFVESILEHIQKRRQIRMLYQHGNAIGGFPIEFVKEDERGLFVLGEINLEVQEGREAYALAKQGVLVDFSIGFSVDEFEMNDDIRTITKATIWEISAVLEPMNPAANITQVKKDEDENVNYYKTEDVKGWGKRELEKALREGAKFSKNASKAIISLNIWTGKDQDEDEDAQDMAEKGLSAEEQKALDSLLEEVKSLNELVKTK